MENIKSAFLIAFAPSYIIMHPNSLYISFRSRSSIFKMCEYDVECRDERRSHSSMFETNVFVCRAEYQTKISIFQVCMILNAELNVDLTARYSRCMFSNAELNVEPIARYSNCVLF